jgi:hypothetical protein
MITLSQLIRSFLTIFCVAVPDNEDPATTDLYMDDHNCIECMGKQYYVPQDNQFYTPEDELMREMLVARFGL